MSQTNGAKPRGGWRKGRRRHPDGGSWSVIRVELAALLRHHSSPGFISAAQLARDLGTHTKTVTKWVYGTYNPDPATQERISTWVAEKRAAVERKRKKA